MSDPMRPLRVVIRVMSAAVFFAGVAPVASQEFDNTIFHFSQIDVDAARASGSTVSRWVGSGWIGTDFDRLWWSTDGEDVDGDFDDVEATALYGHYFRRFWDVVVGYRQDIEPTAQGYLAFGLMGLAPYWFEVAALGYVSQRGRPSLRMDAEIDLYLTQRWVLTPEGEVEWLITAHDALDMSAGIADVEFALRSRYEVRRKFAPYVDLRWVSEKDPRSPDPAGVDVEGFRLGIGFRLIY